MTHREIILEESLRALQDQVRVLREQGEGLSLLVTCWQTRAMAAMASTEEAQLLLSKAERLAAAAAEELNRRTFQREAWERRCKEAEADIDALGASERNWERRCRRAEASAALRKVKLDEAAAWEARCKAAEEALDELDRPIPFIPTGLAG